MTLTAVDLKRHHDAVADPHGRDIVPDGHDLCETFVADSVSGRHGEKTSGHADVEVTAGHHQRSHQGLPSIGDQRVGDFATRVPPGILEHQLVHH